LPSPRVEELPTKKTLPLEAVPAPPAVALAARAERPASETQGTATKSVPPVRSVRETGTLRPPPKSAPPPRGPLHRTLPPKSTATPSRRPAPPKPAPEMSAAARSVPPSAPPPAEAPKPRRALAIAGAMAAVAVVAGIVVARSGNDAPRPEARGATIKMPAEPRDETVHDPGAPADTAARGAPADTAS